MKIGEWDFPDNLYYDRQHGWALVEGNTAVFGITDFAQHSAKQIVYAEVPLVGRTVEQGKTFMSMESGKWVGRIYAPLSGKISSANEELEFDPGIINQSPYDKGWVVKVQIANPDETRNLFKPSDAAYQAYIQAELAKYKDAK